MPFWVGRCYELCQQNGLIVIEFQIPPQVARYASFMFSFLGRGICRSSFSRTKCPTLIKPVYIFIGSVIVGERWFRILPGTIVGFIGVAYAVLEFIPSIEPPANMRYASCFPCTWLLQTNN